MAAGLSGVMVAGAGKVLRSLRRRRPQLPDDPEALAALILELGEHDPAFVAEITEAMAAVTARAAPFTMSPTGSPAGTPTSTSTTTATVTRFA